MPRELSHLDGFQQGGVNKVKKKRKLRRRSNTTHARESSWKKKRA
jgi:hypothetical protein